MPGQPSPDIVQVGLRVTKGLRRRLMAAAKKAGRSLNAEMVDRLELTFDREDADEILDQAHETLDGAARLHKAASGLFARVQEALEAGQSIDDIFPPTNALLGKKKTPTNALLGRKKK